MNKLDYRDDNIPILLKIGNLENIIVHNIILDKLHQETTLISSEESAKLIDDLHPILSSFSFPGIIKPRIFFKVQIIY